MWKLKTTRIVCIHPKGRTQCIFPNSQHTCLYIYWPKVNLYQVVFGQQSVRTLFKSLAQRMSKNHFLPFQINTIILQKNIYKMAAGVFFSAGGHFGCPKITFDHISGHFRSIRNLNIFGQNGCHRPLWMSEIHFRWHFWPFQIISKLFFLIYLQIGRRSPILDVRNSLSIAFLAISDRYSTLIFLEFFDKMAAVGHFGCPKFTFDRISDHFRSMRNFILF